MKWSETYSKESAEVALTSSFSLGKVERTTIVVTPSEQEFGGWDFYTIFPCPVDDFIRAKIEDMLRRLALEQGLVVRTIP